MRVRLVVSSILTGLCSVMPLSLVFAQATPAPSAAPRTTAAPTGAAQAGPTTPAPAATNAPPAAAKSPAAQTPRPAAPAAAATPVAAPGGAAASPAPASATPPIAAGAGEPASPAAPPADASQAVPPEGFDLATALRGTGAALTADEAAARAAKTAPSVARAEAVARSAAIAARQANIALYPRLELEARYTLLSDVPTPAFAEALGPAGAQAFETQQHTGLLEARLTWPVSALFFSIIPQYKAAQKTADAQRLQSRVQASAVGLQAREAFYNYARTRAALMVAKSAQAQAEAHRRDVDALVTAGSLAKVELMRAEAQVAAAKVAVSRTNGSVAIARSALYTVTHLDGTEDFTVNEDLEKELPPLADTGDALFARALANRSELRQLRMSLEAIEHSVDAAQGAQLPQLVIGATADYANPNQRYFGEANIWNESWAAFAAVTWSPNDWQDNSKGADSARAQMAQTLADLEQLEDALRIEVTQAYEDYNAARAALESSRVGIAAAEESYRVRREQFRAGAAVATDVIDAEAELRQARLDLVNAIIDMRIAKARLDRAVEA